MKRLTALILCLVLTLPAMAVAHGSNDVTILPGKTPVNAVVPDFSQLVVGSTTPMDGEFFTALWGNNAADIDVRLLLHDAATIAWMNVNQKPADDTYTGYGANAAVVTDMAMATDPESGDHTYTFTLRDDLKFSDGTRITAKDYVFSVLLQSAKELKELGAVPSTYWALRGHQAYSEGAESTFSGIRLLDDTSFSLTIDGSNLPYFYELTLVSVTPYPIAVLAPGCGIADDGEGAYITGDFTAALLESTLCDPLTGYRSHPSVVSGPYTLESYDAERNVATFALNPYYAGNFEGQIPVIPRIVFRSVNNEDIMSALDDGSINLINKVSKGSLINDGLTRVAHEEVGMGYYLRAGQSFLAFRCEEGLTALPEIRQALMRCVDQQALIDAFLLGYGQKVYGMYGHGQWMVNPQLEALNELDIYPFDTAAAAALFEQAGFAFDAQGGAYESGLRYNKDGEKLSFRMAKTAANPAADETEQMLRSSFDTAGAELSVDTVSSDDMLEMYYRLTENPYDFLFMASNFTFVFDPYFTYHTDPAYAQRYNTSGLKDEKLMALASDLRRTDPSDRDAYMVKWLEFQKYWVSVLPFAPLYTNIYFDFFSPYLEHYEIESHPSWASAILYANFDDVMDPREIVPFESWLLDR